jgi:predicted amidohydrolase YtcJ
MDAGIVVGPSCSSAEPAWKDLIARDEAGLLPIRIVGTVWTRDASDDPHVIVDQLADWSQRLHSDHVQISICKMWVEGSWPAGGALLLEPFSDEPGNRGKMTLTPEHIAAQIEAAHRAGFDMHIHADADGSVRVVLDAIEDVQKRLGQQGRRHTICHLSTTHPDDVLRFKSLSVLANGTPLWGTDYDGVQIDLYEKRLGKQRVEERLLPYGDLVRSGASVSFGADLPGVDIDECPPLIQLEAAVTRKRPGFPDDRALVARQAMTVEQALRAYTISGAYQLRMEHMIGSIEVGKQADLVVLGKSLFDVPVQQIHDVAVLLTLMDGKARHDKLAA